MNLCGSSGGGGTALEVKLDRCLLVGVDFHVAMVVKLGLEICKHLKTMREREERAAKTCGGGNEKPLGYL